MTKSVPSIKRTSQPAIDRQWYDALLQARTGIRETFIALEPDQQALAHEKTRFFEHNGNYDPQLRPAGLDSGQLQHSLKQLQALHGHIVQVEPDADIRAAYHGHITELIVNVRMVLAAASGVHEDFMACNRELYGEPDPAVFAAVCSWIRQDTAASADTAELAALGGRLLALVPDLTGNARMLIPDETVFSQVRDLHRAPGGYYDQLFAPHGLPQAGYIGQPEGDMITYRAIANVGSDYSIKTADDGLWAVLSSTRQVVRPLGYRVDRDYFAGVLAHEVGSHLLEEANGSRSRLQLLRLGLGGFEKGNEGRAYLREQIVYEHEAVFVRQSSWEYILALFLSVALGCGTNGQPYNFSQLYDVLFALHRFWRERRYPRDTNNEAVARDEAWLLAVRIMKGTDGSSSTGGCYMKDIVYLQGNIACWRLAAENPAMILLGDVGKFNLTDPEHLNVLRNLSILD